MTALYFISSFSFFCQFFLKATQLEQMSTDYELIIEQQDIIKNTLEKKQEVIVDTISPHNTYLHSKGQTCTCYTCICHY